MASQAWSSGSLDRIRTGFRQHSVDPPGVVDDVRTLVWLVMATSHVKARPLSVRSLTSGSRHHTEVVDDSVGVAPGFPKNTKR
jgi:hypothetical protein